MRRRLGDLVAMLRRAGAPVSVGEVMDAHEAVAIVGLEREALKAALAATLVKDHAHREAFERAFLACFPPAPAEREERAGAQGGAGAGERGEGDAAGRGAPREPEGRGARAARPRDEPEPREPTSRSPADPAPRSPREPTPRSPRESTPRFQRESAPRSPADPAPRSPREPTPRSPRESAPRSPRETPSERGRAESAAPSQATEGASSARRLARRAALLRQPFRAMPPEALGEARELARQLAQQLRRRWSRRWRASRRGRIDLRRTARLAASRGGIPLALLRRRRRPSRPDLVALLDLSWSTRLASELMLMLLAPCERYFRRVTLLGFVADIVPISLERGHVVPHAPLDLDAPSDTGRALASFGAGTQRLRGAVLLVLGDGRNNRRPARAEELSKLRRRSGLVAWLVPEPLERWGAGDSAMPAYERVSDVTLAVPDLGSLAAALARLPGRIARGRRAIRAARPR